MYDYLGDDVRAETVRTNGVSSETGMDHPGEGCFKFNPRVNSYVTLHTVDTPVH